MKPSFHARLVNGPFEDPGLYLRLLRESRALLFDSGFTTNLSARDMLKVSEIFITHAHVDHFIGLDSILRLHLQRERTLRLFGPEGFLGHVEGKLKSYSWNLIEEYPLVIEAAEVSGQLIRKAVFRAQNSFVREELGPEPFRGTVLEDFSFRVSAVVLDHMIPCLAFSLVEDYHINVDKAKLTALGIPVGPWLGEFKNAIRRHMHDSVFTVNGRSYGYGEIRDIATITKGQKVSYISDILGSEENIRKAVSLARGSDILYIEAYFLEKDRARAAERYHLTARQAGRIAREAAVARMEVFHFSPKYMDNPLEIIKEAEEEFRKKEGV